MSKSAEMAFEKNSVASAHISSTVSFLMSSSSGEGSVMPWQRATNKL